MLTDVFVFCGEKSYFCDWICIFGVSKLQLLFIFKMNKTSQI